MRYGHAWCMQSHSEGPEVGLLMTEWNAAAEHLANKATSRAVELGVAPVLPHGTARNSCVVSSEVKTFHPLGELLEQGR